MAWTRFKDMHSGGESKEDWQYIYIELPEVEAVRYFGYRFGHDPDNVTCTCCGEDYYYDEEPSIELATAYDRGCQWNEQSRDWDLSSAKMSVDEYEVRPDVLFIRADETITN